MMKLVIRNAALAAILLTFFGCSIFRCDNVSPSAPFDLREIQKEYPKAAADSAAFYTGVQLIRGRAMQNAFSDKKKATGSSYTQGVSQLSIDAKLVTPSAKIGQLNPTVSALTAEGQRSLLEDYQGTRTAKEIGEIVEKLTVGKKAAGPIDPFNATYALHISSDVTTGNIHDRFEEIVVLALLDQQMSKRFRVDSLASIENSELTELYGTLTQEETFNWKLGASLAGMPLPIGGTVGASGEVGGSTKDALVQILSEKSIATNSHLNTGPRMALKGFWVKQSGTRDHKLRHSLVQNFTLATDKFTTDTISDVWTLVENPDVAQRAAVPKVLRPLQYAVPPDIGMHVFAYGIVREIDSEDAPGMFNTTHTPGEADDTVNQHVVTAYQHLMLPKPSQPQYWVRFSGTLSVSRETIKIRYPVGSKRREAIFTTREDAQAFVDALTNATWQAPSPTIPSVHADVLGTRVFIENLVDETRKDQLMQGTVIY